MAVNINISLRSAVK